MDSSLSLEPLSRHLAGIFQNRQQALAEPAWFVHIRLWIHPIALFSEDSFTFFLEQASAAYPQPPYRQRILRLRLSSELPTAEYYALKQPQAYQGAAQAPERLKSLAETDLQSLTDSSLIVSYHQQPQATRYEARLPTGKLCQFTVEGETKYVELAFDIVCKAGETTFLMYDKGIDPETSKATWGALNGPFRLQKIEDWSAAIPKR